MVAARLAVVVVAAWVAPGVVVAAVVTFVVAPTGVAPGVIAAAAVMIVVVAPWLAPGVIAAALLFDSVEDAEAGATGAAVLAPACDNVSGKLHSTTSATTQSPTARHFRPPMAARRQLFFLDDPKKEKKRKKKKERKKKKKSEGSTPSVCGWVAAVQSVYVPGRYEKQERKRLENETQPRPQTL